MLLVIISTSIIALFLLYIYDCICGKHISSELLARMIQRYQNIHGSEIIIIVDDDLHISNDHIISIENSYDFIQKLRYCNENHKQLDIIIHSTGGSIEESDIIVNAILEHKYPIHCYVPRFANSAATFIALSTDKIHMDPYAYLSPTDPQITIDQRNDDDEKPERTYSSKILMDYLKYVDNHESYEIQEELFLDAKDAEQLHQDNIRALDKIFDKKCKHLRNNKNVYNKLCSGDFPHHSPLYYTELHKLGLHVKLNIPLHINQIFRRFEKYFII